MEEIHETFIVHIPGFDVRVQALPRIQDMLIQQTFFVFVAYLAYKSLMFLFEVAGEK